jgi:hypothetical protein
MDRNFLKQLLRGHFGNPVRGVFDTAEIWVPSNISAKYRCSKRPSINSPSLGGVGKNSFRFMLWVFYSNQKTDEYTCSRIFLLLKHCKIDYQTKRSQFITHKVCAEITFMLVLAVYFGANQKC